MVAFKTKAESLEVLAPLLRNSRVLPQVRFTVRDWRCDADTVLAAIAATSWGNGRIIVRSSAVSEDATEGNSQAGKYDSVAGVVHGPALIEAINQVIASFGEGIRLTIRFSCSPCWTR